MTSRDNLAIRHRASSTIVHSNLLADSHFYILSTITMPFKRIPENHRISSYDSIASNTIPSEAFNIPSSEEEHLLSDFREATGEDSILAAPWACFHVCDKTKFRQIVNSAKTRMALSQLDDISRCLCLCFMVKRPSYTKSALCLRR